MFTGDPAFQLKYVITPPASGPDENTQYPPDLLPSTHALTPSRIDCTNEFSLLDDIVARWPEAPRNEGSIAAADSAELQPTDVAITS